MKRPWQHPVAGEITISNGQGTEIPVTVKGYAAGSIEPLKRLAKARGVHLVHDSMWPPIAVLSWETLNQIVRIGTKPDR